MDETGGFNKIWFQVPAYLQATLPIPYTNPSNDGTRSTLNSKQRASRKKRNKLSKQSRRNNR